jgi:hypothetical protein
MEHLKKVIGFKAWNKMIWDLLGQGNATVQTESHGIEFQINHIWSLINRVIFNKKSLQLDAIN